MTAITDQNQAAAPFGFWILLTASLVSSLIMLDSNIVAVSLPAMARSLGASFTDIQWVISAYVLTYASLLLASGNYADLYGRKRAMIIGLLVFAVASVGCGLATTSTLLNVARGVQGVGGALLLTASLAIIGNAFKGAERTRAFAFWGASLGIALAVGPIVGGVITSTIGWRWVFLVNIPACAILIAATFRFIDESRDPSAKNLDFGGIVTFSGGLALLVWGLIDGNDAGWSSPTILIRLATAAVLFAVFVVVELRTPQPMVDFNLFKKDTFLGAVLAMIGYGASAQVMIFLPAGCTCRTPTTSIH
jgi:EmrB/QacA subfamily drug resistance transporter